MKWLWPTLIPLAASAVVRGPATAVAAAMATLLAALLTREVTQSRRLRLWAGLVTAAVVTSLAAGLAASTVLATLLARSRGASPWWAAALLPLALLSGPLPLPSLLAPVAPSPAWAWAAAVAPALLAVVPSSRAIWAATASALLLVPLAPVYALAGLAAALVVRLAWSHPANRSWATGSARAGVVLAAAPGILLLLVAIAGRTGAGAPLATLRLAWLALALGLLLLAALRGSSFLFLATDAAAPALLAATWSAWAVAAVGTLVDWPRIGVGLLGAAASATGIVIVLGIHMMLPVDKRAITTWALVALAAAAALL